MAGEYPPQLPAATILYAAPMKQSSKRTNFGAVLHGRLGPDRQTMDQVQPTNIHYLDLETIKQEPATIRQR